MASNLTQLVRFTEAYSACYSSSGYSHHFWLATYVVKVLKRHAIAQSAVARVAGRSPRTPLQTLLQQASWWRRGLNRWYVLTYPDVVCMVVRLDCEHTFTTALYGRILLNGKVFLFFYGSGMTLSPLILRPQTGLLYQRLMTEDYRILQKWYIAGENRRDRM